MNKKGFIHVVEAVIAIIIVFAAILALLPKTNTDLSKMPSELESSAKATLEEIANNEKFRLCILQGQVNSEASPKCISGFVESTLPYGSSLNYAFAIENTTGKYFYDHTGDFMGYLALEGSEGIIIKGVMPEETNIYSKSIFISVEDVTAIKPTTTNIGNYQTVRLYFWFKIEEQ